MWFAYEVSVQWIALKNPGTWIIKKQTVFLSDFCTFCIVDDSGWGNNSNHALSKLLRLFCSALMHCRFLFTDIGGSTLELHILPVDFRFRYIGWSLVACNVCMIFVLFSIYPSLVLPQCWKLNPTAKQAIVLIWDPSDDLHYNGWMARRCQKSKAGHAIYCSCNWPYDEVMLWYVYLPESSIYNAYLPWNSTIDTKYSHIWSRRCIIQTYPKHHCW